MSTVSLFVGVDVGGTTSTVAIGNAEREVLKLSDQFPTRSSEGPRATIAAIVEQLKRSLSALGASLQQVARASIATPGPATADGVFISTSPNLSHPSWSNCPIRELLEESLQAESPSTCAGYIGDGQAAALGEYAVRAGRAIRTGDDVRVDRTLTSLYMLTVGTGLGGGEVRDGVVVRGGKGRAGHAGHIMLPHDAFRYDHDRQLKVGNAYSTVESAVSLTALTHQLPYRLNLPEWQDHPLNRMPGDAKDKAKRLRELATAGDTLAMQLFDDQAAAMGIALLSLNYIGDYDLLVIGGGVCDLAEAVRSRYLSGVRESYYQRALDGFRDLPPIEFSVCGDDASVIGALVHARG